MTKKSRGLTAPTDNIRNEEALINDDQPTSQTASLLTLNGNGKMSDPDWNHNAADSVADIELFENIRANFMRETNERTNVRL